MLIFNKKEEEEEEEEEEDLTQPYHLIIDLNIQVFPW